MATMQALQQENEELKSKCADLKKKLNSLRRAAAPSTRVVKGDTVHVNIPRLSKANENIEKQNQEEKDKEYECLLDKIKKLEGMVSSLRDENDKLIKDLEDSKLRCATLQDEVDNQGMVIKKKTYTIATINTEKETLEDHLRNALALASKAETERDEYKSKYNACREEAESLRESNTQLQNEKSLLLQDLANEAENSRRCKERLVLETAEKLALGKELDQSKDEQARLRRMIGAGGALAAMAKDKEAELTKSLAEAHQTIEKLTRFIKR
eukprot:m.283814 g.283814  ORF g.283814 m.283814 type:complete len:269 (-) comp16338_c2_seq106:94-900(-)